MENISYERCAYESVDDKSLSQNLTGKMFQALMGVKTCMPKECLCALESYPDVYAH